ncbi:MAG: glycoside hydrolase [Ferruginibacter sp.]|nr:glycoside hydrolase [Ferruginibacter sp.]
MKKLLSGVFIVALLVLFSKISAQDISVSGWRLWPDSAAKWKDDKLYLPNEVNIPALPVNMPTGGWQALNDKQGIPVKLPSTVEEHYWGKFGTRPYTKNEAQRGAGTSFQNGNYPGVSWWWRQVNVPDFKAGQHVAVSFRGARLRAEVYCNGKLCGYTIMSELPFQADITNAVKAGGKAQIAVRITNPGGSFDWLDFAQMQIQWGNYTLPPSHGFGGLDNDIKLAVRDNVSVTDIAAINQPDLNKIQLVAEISSLDKAYNGPVIFQVSKGSKVVWTGTANIALTTGQSKTIMLDATIKNALPWNVKHPNLYTATASLTRLKTNSRSVDFGFRYFTAEGIGSKEAKLTLNGKRIVPISSISWGYWGRNGLWPDQEMGDREMASAKALGLNCLQFHRNIGKPLMLDLSDRKGFMRVEEPGGGKFALGARYAIGPFGPNDEFLAKDEKLLNAFKVRKDYVQPDTDTVNTTGDGPDGDARAFWEKYEEAKILQMVKRDRSHPSLIMYTIQNENSDMDLRNPRIYRLLRSMHALDPGRLIVFYSGGVPKDAQVMMLPHSNTIQYASKGNPFAGWHDVHTCGGPCNYLDALYKNPRDFKVMQKDEDRGSICMWGEMFGAATPDDYDKLIHSFDKEHPTGYELDDMKKTLDGYHQFLDKWGFRKAFPTDSSLFQAIGYRSYYFWKRILEQSRIENSNDFLVVSGWESTTIDNHSGIVDNHRFPKGNPAVMAEACGPELLVVQPRRMILNKGDKEIVDVFLINETNRTGPQTLKLTVKRADGSMLFTTEKTVVPTGGDVYGELLTEAIEFTADKEGMLKIESQLTPQTPGATVLKRTDEISVVDITASNLLKKIAVVEPNHQITQTIRDDFKGTPVKLAETPANTVLDAIVMGNISANTDLFKLGDAPKAAAVSQNLIPENLQGVAAKPEVKLPSLSGISKELFEDALRRVKEDGTRLILWPDNDHGAEAFAKELAKRNIVQYKGNAGNLGAPWFGSWFFVRKHWLLEGLPTDCAMDWRYGISAFGGPEWLKEDPKGTNTNGMMLDAPGLEVVIGYGADHNEKIGVSGCVIPYGKGEIVLYCLPQMLRSLQPGEFAINPVIIKRILSNALRIKS